jgi:GntR family transcriptional regulator of arabinose operon
MKNDPSAIRLEHNSYISLHVQLHNQLRQLILSGKWAYQERIPSELQLTQHLNISRTTVRIALQSAEMEGLIRRVAGRGTFVSYRPGEGALTPRFIGYVTRSFHNDLHSMLLSSVEMELRSASYRVIFSNATNNEQAASVLNELLADDVAGLIMWPNANPIEDQIAALQAYQDQNIPIVFIDRFVDGIEADFVTSDNFGGMRQLVDHLVQIGHTDIVHLMHNVPNLHPINERLRGYEATMRSHGLTVHEPWKINSPHKDEFDEIDIHELLDETAEALINQVIARMERASPMPTAISCANDAMAIIAMRAMREMGLSVPEDVSIAGFDDIKLTSYLDTPLTTIAQDAHEIGRQAAGIIRDRLDGNTAPPQQLIVPTRLQIRMSTSVPRNAFESLSDNRKE